MTEQQPQPDLTSQFRELGDNLKNMLQTAWQSDEAHNLRQDIKDGLNELGKAANDAVTEFNASEAGQHIKDEAQEFKSRVQSGEVETQAREEISKILNTINTELDKAISQLSKSENETEE
jgi:hypothetical protein